VSGPHLHTAAQRSPTGLDVGARLLIYKAVAEIAGVPPNATISLFFEDRFGSIDDYLAAVEEVHGYDARSACTDAIDGTRDGFSLMGDVDPEKAALALLGAMPAHDFMTAIESALVSQRKAEQATKRIGDILQNRGIPYRFNGINGFAWVGDTEVERELVEPAVAAINDSRFAGGVRDEFQQARRELRHGTPNGRKQAVHEAGCAVESAMKVVLTERGLPFKENDSASVLIGHLRTAGLLPNYMEPTINAVITPRNKAAGHGGGVMAVDPGEDEAATVLASAAGAIAYLKKKLP
jgi:hypothetical protein